MSAEQLELDFELTLRYPYPVRYYRQRAEEALWRRHDFKSRFQQSSAGARK